MSKNATVACTIKEADPSVVQRALESMVKLNKGNLTLLNKNKLKVYCSKLSTYPCFVDVINNEIQITGEDFEMENAKSFLEDYYNATISSEELNMPLEEIDENGYPLLTLEV